MRVTHVLLMLLASCDALKAPIASVSRRSVVMAPAAALLSNSLAAMAEEEVEPAPATEAVEAPPVEEPPKTEEPKKSGFRFPWDNETDEEKEAKRLEKERKKKENEWIPPPQPPGSTGIFGKEGLPKALDKLLFGKSK